MVSNYTLIELPYETNLIHRYANLVDLPGFVLLESGDNNRGRYDILSACPTERFYCHHYAYIHDYLNKLQQVLTISSSNITLPFQGGLIGYVSYDLGAAMQGIISPHLTALGNRACDHLANFAWYDWAIISDHAKKTVTLFAANRYAETKEVVATVLAKWQQAPVVDNKIALAISEFEPLITKNQYYESFHHIQQALSGGRCYQVNYTQPFVAAYRGNTWAIFAKIRQDNAVPFSAYLRSEDYDLLSFSPERFLWYEQGHILTSPIKGTAPRLNDKTLDAAIRVELQNCHKNRAENTMIVDLLRNDLSKIAQKGSVKVSALCEVESYQSVHHLVSTIEADCRTNIHPISAFLSCFPGGSITGAPKREAMRVIYEQEPYARSAYCGSIAYFSSHGRFDSNIAIRTLIANDTQLSLSAGGGIVIDSLCDDEYAECLVKIKSLRSAMGV